MIVMMLPYFDRDDFNAFRGFLFMATGFSGIVPVVHISTAVDPQYLHHFHLGAWLAGGLTYVLGTFFYITQYPECSHKSKFDIWGSSHQIFHVCIVAAALMHYYGSVQVFHDRQLYSCPLPTSLY